MQRSDAIWIAVLEVGTAEKMLKAKPLLAHFNPIWNDVMFSWNCLEKMENNEA